MDWTIVDSGALAAEENMRIDAEWLADLAPDDRPILRFYAWDAPSVTYGHFISPECFFTPPALKNESYRLAKRPTGGGITFHTGDLTFSILIPSGSPYFNDNTLANYAFVNNRLIQAIHNLLPAQTPHLFSPAEAHAPSNADHYCMARPTRYDVMLMGKKIAGGAQRRGRQGFLHQGSIFIQPPDTQVVREILQDSLPFLASMQENSLFLKSLFPQVATIEEIRALIKDSLKKLFLK